MQSADAAGLLPVCSPLSLRQDGGELHQLHPPCGHGHHQVSGSPPDLFTVADVFISGPSPLTLSTPRRVQDTPPGPALCPRPPPGLSPATPLSTTPPHNIQTILNLSRPPPVTTSSSTIITGADNSPRGHEVTSLHQLRGQICPRSGQSASTGSGRRRSWLNITSCDQGSPTSLRTIVICNYNNYYSNNNNNSV